MVSVAQVCQLWAGAMPSTVSGPIRDVATSALANPGGTLPAATSSMALAKMRRLAMITLSEVPKCSRVRFWMAPMLSQAH